MSSQDQSGVPFSIHHRQQNFRLLELPNALLELLTCQNPPILHLKSTPSTSSSGEGNALLCSHDQTFEIRQVQSSNILFVLQNEDLAIDGHGGKRTGVTAIAQCKSLLELGPVKTNAVNYLRKSLPIYTIDPSTSLTSLTSGQVSSSAQMLSKATWEQDVPFSTGEFNESWVEICGFETDGRAWLPSAGSLRGLWTSIMSASLLSGTEITKAFEVKALESAVEEDGHPRALLHSVLRRIRASYQISVDGLTAIDRDSCVLWLGTVILDTCGSEGAPRAEILAQWQNLLPETWREHAQMGLLQSKVVEINGDKVCSMEMVETSESSAVAQVKPRTKWHEKLKAKP